MTVYSTRTTVSTGASTAPRHADHVRLPNDWVGRLLDDPDGYSAEGIHLTAISIYRRLTSPRWTLSEGYCRRHHSIGERRFRGGLAHLEDTGILTRRRGGRDPAGKPMKARDTWVPSSVGDYVAIPVVLLDGDSRLLGFVAATLLGRMPRDAADIAHRIGLSRHSRNSISRLVQAAVAGGYIAARRVGSRWIVARPDMDLGTYGRHGAAHCTPGPVQNVAVQNVAVQSVAVQSVATHSILLDPQRDLADEHRNRESSCPGARTTAPAVAAARQQNDDRDGRNHDGYRVLSDWRTARTMREDGGVASVDGGCSMLLYPRLNPQPAYVTRAQWASIASRCGWVPEYFTTHAAHRQIMDIASVLHRLLGEMVEPIHILYGIAHRLHTTLRRHRRISSLAIIAQPLMLESQHRGDAWVYDVPSILDDDAQDHAMTWARRYLQLAHERGIDTHERALLGTISIETLATMIAGGQERQIEAAVSSAPKPAAGRWVNSWTYFQPARPAPQSVQPEIPDVAALAEDLRRHDPAKLLAWHMMAPRGIVPYARLVSRYGRRVRDHVVAILAEHADGGYPRGCITRWVDILGEEAMERARARPRAMRAA